MIGRRTILAGLMAATAPRATLGQGLRPARLIMLSLAQSSIDSFRHEGLPAIIETGWTEGHNLAFDTASINGRLDQLPAAALRLAGMRPDVAVAVSNPVGHALRAADPALPIVMSFAGNDPVADGLAASIARPGGSVTGVVMLADELNIKRLELARELAPNGRPLGYLVGVHLDASRIDPVKAAAERLGIPLVVASAQSATGDAVTLPPAFRVFRETGVAAIVVASSPVLSGMAAQIAAHCAEARLPAVTEWRTMARAGCLASYGPNERALRRLAANYVVRILRGERPAEMPMQGPTHFEFIINMTAARAIGQVLPPAFLARADEVIE